MPDFGVGRSYFWSILALLLPTQWAQQEYLPNTSGPCRLTGPFSAYSEPCPADLGTVRPRPKPLIFRGSVSLVWALWLVLCGVSVAQDATARDTWQRPDEVIDAMQARLGSTVADVGAGEGWFTRKLAQRVGTEGTVFAVDVQPAMVEEIRHWSTEEHIHQVIPVLGAENDPHLPAGQLDAILVVNAYHEMRAYDAMLRCFYQALKLEGRLVVIEPEAKLGRPRAEYQKEHVIPVELVKADAARNNFKFVEPHADVITPDLHHWSFLVFAKSHTKDRPN